MGVLTFPLGKTAQSPKMGQPAVLLPKPQRDSGGELITAVSEANFTCIDVYLQDMPNAERLAFIERRRTEVYIRSNEVEVPNAAGHVHRPYASFSFADQSPEHVRSRLIHQFESKGLIALEKGLAVGQKCLGEIYRYVYRRDDRKVIVNELERMTGQTK